MFIPGRSMSEIIARLFGSGKKGEPPSPQQAIQKLRETEEMLSKKSEFLEKKIDQELAAAKKYGLKNKRGMKFRPLKAFSILDYIRAT